MTTYPIFTEEHEALRDSVRRFVDQELRPHVDEWEEAGWFPDEVFRRAGALGFLGLHYPERWGGAGGDLAAEIVFVEELAKAGCGAIAMALSVQTDMATPAIDRFGTDDQKERYLRPATRGPRSPRSRSLSPTPAPMLPPSRLAPAATVTCGGSPAASSSSPTEPAPTFSPWS